MENHFDVIVVGAGPGGVFCVYELNRLNPNLKILLIDKGTKRAITDTKNNLFGWMGAGAFSDGKLDLTHKVGGQLVERNCVTLEEFNELMAYAESLYEEHGGKQSLKIGDKIKIAELAKRANAAGLELIPYPLKHWGREGAYLLAESLWKHFEQPAIKNRVKILMDSEVVSLKNQRDVWQVTTKNQENFSSDFLILSLGRAGADWEVREFKKLNVKMEDNPVDGGVRVETKKIMLEELTSVLHEFKLTYLTRERRDRVRTFCVCPGGKVVKEEGHGDIVLVNGQTDKNSQTENTNFAILVSISFDKPFNDANAYGRDMARLSTRSSNGSVLLQTLADWQNKRRSKPSSLINFPVRPTLPEAVPGDLRGLALPERFSAAIDEMLVAMDKLIPGMNNGNNVLIYGPEVKFYSKRVIFQNGFETNIPRLYVVGDGSGLTRGLLQSTIMGIKTAQDINNRK